MCRYIQYQSSRCHHNIHSRPFCVELCPSVRLLGPDRHPSLYTSAFNRVDIPRPCDRIQTDRIRLHNYCYECAQKGFEWPSPDDPRLAHVIEGPDPKKWVWWVDEMPINDEVKFQTINWNPDPSTVGEANADKEPVSPMTILPVIPTQPCLRESILNTASSLLGKRKACPAPTPPEADFTVDQRSLAVPLPPIAAVPPTQKPNLQIIPMVLPQFITHATTNSSSNKPIVFDATDPSLLSLLERGESSRQYRQNLRRGAVHVPHQDLPVPSQNYNPRTDGPRTNHSTSIDTQTQPSRLARLSNQIQVDPRFRVIAETRVRLEESGRESSARFTPGLRFRSTKKKLLQSHVDSVSGVENGIGHDDRPGDSVSHDERPGESVGNGNVEDQSGSVIGASTCTDGEGSELRSSKRSKI